MFKKVINKNYCKGLPSKSQHDKLTFPKCILEGRSINPDCQYAVDVENNNNPNACMKKQNIKESFDCLKDTIINNKCNLNEYFYYYLAMQQGNNEQPDSCKNIGDTCIPDLDLNDCCYMKSSDSASYFYNLSDVVCDIETKKCKGIKKNN